MGDINIDTSEEQAIGMTKLCEFCDIFDLENLITGSTCETPLLLLMQYLQIKSEASKIVVL